MVEAKNENTMSGLGQCSAEMVAAQLFNARENSEVQNVYGAITSGVAWKFLKLQDHTVSIDLRDYSVAEHPGKVMGILAAMIEQKL